MFGSSDCAVNVAVARLAVSPRSAVLLSKKRKNCKKKRKRLTEVTCPVICRIFDDEGTLDSHGKPTSQEIWMKLPMSPFGDVTDASFERLGVPQTKTSQEARKTRVY